jgi:hypothetical protein
MNEDPLLKQLRGMKSSPRLEADLWPRMRQRLQDEQPPRFTRWDWAIAAGIGAAILLYPELAAALLYNL